MIGALLTKVYMRAHDFGNSHVPVWPLWNYPGAPNSPRRSYFYAFGPKVDTVYTWSPWEPVQMLRMPRDAEQIDAVAVSTAVREVVAQVPRSSLQRSLTVQSENASMGALKKAPAK